MDNLSAQHLYYLYEEKGGQCSHSGEKGTPPLEEKDKGTPFPYEPQEKEAYKTMLPDPTPAKQK